MHAGLCVVRSKFGIIFRKREKKKEKKKNWGEPGKGEGILHVPQKETPASYIPFCFICPLILMKDWQILHHYITMQSMWWDLLHTSTRFHRPYCAFG